MTPELMELGSVIGLVIGSTVVIACFGCIIYNIILIIIESSEVAKDVDKLIEEVEKLKKKKRSK